MTPLPIPLITCWFMSPQFCQPLNWPRKSRALKEKGRPFFAHAISCAPRRPSFCGRLTDGGGWGRGGGRAKGQTYPADSERAAGEDQPFTANRQEHPNNIHKHAQNHHWRPISSPSRPVYLDFQYISSSHPSSSSSSHHFWPSTTSSMAAQFPLLTGANPFLPGLPQFLPANPQPILMHPQQQQLPSSFLINNFHHQNSLPAPTNALQNATSFSGFTRPSSARPAAQLRRASSASMEAAAARSGTTRGGNTSSMGTALGGTRPASLQHHELLLFNGGDHPQRTTPLPCKFESTEMAALLAGVKTAQEGRGLKEETTEDVRQQLNHHLHQKQQSAAAAAPLSGLRRNNSLSTAPSSNFSAPSPVLTKGGPHSAGIGQQQQSPYPSMYSPQSGAASNAIAGVDSNVTLWQFLLELLAANDHPNLIQWTNNEGEFKLHDAEAVARLWGIRKGKPNMNYDKLSRALRYYYDKNIIKKVIGQKFVYRFVMDSKGGGGMSGGGAESVGSPGNPELVMYAMRQAGINMNIGGGGGAATEGGGGGGHGPTARFEHPLSLHPPSSTTSSANFLRATPSCSSSTADLSKPASIGSSLRVLNPNGANPQQRGAATALTPSPANSSCSPTGSVESSSGVSSGSGMSAFAVPNGGGIGNGAFGCGGVLGGMVQIKQEPGLFTPHNSSLPSTSSAAQPMMAEKARQTRKRKSPSEQTTGPRMMEAGGNIGGQNRQQSQDDASAPKIGCGANNNNNSGQPGQLSRRARPQPLDLTSVNNTAASVSNLAGQMSQMVASSPLLFALQQHHHQQQQQQSPLLSAAISALSNYAASPLASVASPLAQAAAFQLASNLVATLSPKVNSSAANNVGTGGNGSGTSGIGGNYHQLPATTTIGNNNNNNPLNAATTLYNQLHSALTTPIAANQVKTPQQHQQFSNSAMISAVINHLTNGPNTPFAAQQQQQQIQAQQQQSLFQFPPTSNMAIAHTLAMLSSPGLPLAGQSPFPFMSQMAALQTPKFSATNFQGAGVNQRSPDSLKTPMGGLSFEFGQALAAAAANKK